MQDLQSAWLLLLFCASSRATFFSACACQLSPILSPQYDNQVWQCLCALFVSTRRQCSAEYRPSVAHGGLGVRSASRTCHAAYWSSWADCLSTFRERHRNIDDDGRAQVPRTVGSPFGWCCCQSFSPRFIGIREPFLAGSSRRFATPSTDHR